MKIPDKKALVGVGILATLMLVACSIATVIALNVETRIETAQEMEKKAKTATSDYMDQKDLAEKLRKENNTLRKLLPLKDSEESGDMPLKIVEPEGEHVVVPVSPMSFKVGEWTETPWEGVSCFGVSLTPSEVVIICDVMEPIRLPPHTHGPWEETVVLFEGALYGHISGSLHVVGGDNYFVPANKLHEPEFLSPSRLIIVWRKEGES